MRGLASIAALSCLWWGAYALPWGDVYLRLAGAALAVIALSWRATFLIRPPSWRRQVTQGLGVGIALALATRLAVGWMGSLWPQFPYALGDVYASNGLHRPILELSLTGLVIVGEEWLWREYGWRVLPPQWPPLGKATVLVLLYTFAQSASGAWPVMLAALLLGVVWTWLRARSGSWWAPVLSHAVWTYSVLLWPLV